MSNVNLEKFTNALENNWDPVTSALTLKSKQLLEELTPIFQQDEWYIDLVENKYADKKVFRSEKMVLF